MERTVAERLSEDLLGLMQAEPGPARQHYRDNVLLPVLIPLPHESIDPFARMDPSLGKAVAYVVGAEALSVVEGGPWPAERDPLPHVGVMSYPLGGNEWSVSCEARPEGLDGTAIEWVFYFADREIIDVTGMVVDCDADAAQAFAHALAGKVGARVAAFTGS